MQKPQNLNEFLSMSLDKKKLLADNGFWSSTPIVNYTPLHKLKDTSLVRFRGMVQDMMGPEIYLERYEVSTANGDIRIQDGKYRDCLVDNAGENINYYAPSNKLAERNVLFLVSLPCQNTWCKEYEAECNEKNITKEISTNAGSNVKKRPAPTDGMEVDDVDATISNKRQFMGTIQENNATGSTGTLGREYLLNSPIPDRPSKACIVKLYDVDSCVLNELIDVIGFLSVHPSLDASMMDSEMIQEFDIAIEIEAQNPPPSLIPRIHVIGMKKLTHANPLLDLTLHQPTQTSLPLNMASVQKELHTLLSLCLFNDELAAEYLLSHLISTVYNRHEMESIGKFSLNICNLPQNCLAIYTTKLYEILNLLLPASHYLPLTLETLNNVAFVPKKDNMSNKLVSGYLQLAPHTHLVLDETRMSEGKLQPNGFLNFRHLTSLLKYQKVQYDFECYQKDFDANIPVLTLSEGRSMLQTDFVMPIETDGKSIELVEETLKAADYFLNQASRLEQFRCFLTLARVSGFNFTDRDDEFIQNDFIEMRKQGIMDNGDELHRLLIMTRYISIARGKPQFNEESWKLAKDFEEKRHKRVTATIKSK